MIADLIEVLTEYSMISHLPVVIGVVLGVSLSVHSQG